MALKAIKVYIKIRPLIAREKNENASSVWQTDGNTIKSIDKQHEMSFDHIYDETTTTQKLFEDMAKPIVTSALNGINGTIFAYGQTSSGKTHTMMGDEDNPGIIPLTVNEIFKQIEGSEDREFLIRIGYIEIYNEKIFDLLDTKNRECLKLYEAAGGEGCRADQIEYMAISVQQILEYYERGNKARRFGETNMNERSSRSHTIFRITIESREVGKTAEECAVQVSNLNLVDLAGSERADQTKADGDRLKEGGHINKSLLALGNVIRVLSDDTVTASTHINYRDSKLTRLLSASLGGNAMTSIICTVTPAALDETFYTLVFAQNAKKIKNKPKVNEVMSDQAIMKRMQREIQDLKNQLESRNTELNHSQNLKQAISQKEGQFLHSHNVTSMKPVEKTRRRTWCPSTNSIVAVPEPVPAFRYCPVPSFFLEPSERNMQVEVDQEIREDEIFTPGEETNLDRTLSPGPRDTVMLASLIRTPSERVQRRPADDSPNPFQKVSRVQELEAQNKYLQEELQELQDFQKVETIIQDDSKKLTQKLNFANDQNALLELRVEELQMKIQEMEERIDSNVELQNAKAERLNALKEKKTSEDVLNSIRYEHELFREKAKKRESELIQELHDAWKESQSDIYLDKIKTLEEQLKKSEELLLSVQLQSDDIKTVVQPETITSGDANGNDRISELEKNIQSYLDNENKQKKALEEMRQKHTRMMTEYDQISTQLMELIQENENLNKRTEQLEATRNDENYKYQLIECILTSIRKEEVLPPLDSFDQDDSIQTLMQLHIDHNEWKCSENALNELQIEVNALRNENDMLKANLPTIQESMIESECELRDKCDLLEKERETINVQFEAETTRRKELEQLIQKLQSDLASNRMFLDSLRSPTFTESKTTFNSTESQTSFEADQASTFKAVEDQLAKSVQERDALAVSISQLQASLEEKLNKVEELEGALTCQETEMTSVIAELRDELQRIMSMGEENVRLKIVEKDHKRLVNEFTVKIDEMQTINEEAKAAKGLVQVHKQRIHELEINETNNKKKLEQLEKELTQKSDVAMSFESEIQMLIENNERLTKSANEAASFKEQSLDLEVMLHETQDELAQVRKQLYDVTHVSEMVGSNTSEEFEALAQKTLEEQVEANKLLAELQEKVELLKEELEQSKQSHVENTFKLQQEFEDQQKFAAHQVSLLETKLQNQSISGEEPSKLENELNDMRAASESLASELEVYKIKFEDLQNQMATKEESIKILEGWMNDKNQEAEELHKNMELIPKYINEIQILKKLLEEAEKERDELKNAVTLSNELKVELTSIKAEKLLQDVNYEEMKKNFDALTAQGNEAKELCKSLQQDLSTIDAENTNLKSKLIIIEEEMKTLQSQLKERTEEYDEIKNRYRRRSFDNDKKLQNIESEKSELVQRIGAIEAEKSIIQQELQKLKSEHFQVVENLKSQLKSENEKLKVASSENDMKYSTLDEKHSQLIELNQKLEAEIDKLQKQQKPQLNSIIKVNERLEHDVNAFKEQIAQITNELSISHKTITDLRVERDGLIQQVEEIKKTSIKKLATSPDTREKRMSDELYVSRNQQLLLEGVPTPTRAVERNVERKNRRQCAHDEHRRLSNWERFTNTEVQTDNVSEICACFELNQKLKDLQIELKKKDLKLKNMERLALHNPLKLDVDDLKKSLTREERDHQQTKANLEAMGRNVFKLEAKVEALKKNQIIEKNVISSSCQTVEETLVKKSDYDVLESKFNEMKRVCHQRQEKINELEGAFGKENVSSNIVNKSSAIENENSMLKKKLQDLEEKQTQDQTDDGKVCLKTEFDKMKDEFNKLDKKYEMTRRLCNLRNNDIVQLNAEITKQNELLFKLRSSLETKDFDYKKLRIKYQNAKDLCTRRLEEINKLTSCLPDNE